jgi:hypothetical protein
MWKDLGSKGKLPLKKEKDKAFFELPEESSKEVPKEIPSPKKFATGKLQSTLNSKEDDKKKPSLWKQLGRK